MRLKLADLFVKPMQRVTKYALLLKAILGKTTEEEEKSALENMVSHYTLCRTREKPGDGDSRLAHGAL